MGTGSIVVGIVDTGIGAVGVLVRKPGTTAGGVPLTALGVNTIGAGISQLSGANQNHGYHVIGLGFEKGGAALAAVADLEPPFGSLVGRGSFW